ncbi:MAG: purine-binding chemotaxis protein CheW [Glaciecola sp.]
MKDKHKFAKESVVEDYLTDLLTEAVTEPSIEKVIAQKLLDKALVSTNLSDVDEHRRNVKGKEPKSAAVLVTDIEQKIAELLPDQQIIEQVDKEIQSEVEIKTSSLKVTAPLSLQDSLDERFQALFFEVAGLTLAVPLIELGGIHEITKISPLIGKPDWFMGVMLKNQDKFNVVDSALWVMPEKYDTALAENLNYKFMINLGKTPWGLACEKLVNTVELNKSDVKWRSNSGKRPWLAGMVKEKMCALINVSELVELLQLGESSK